MRRKPQKTPAALWLKKHTSAVPLLARFATAPFTSVDAK
jgi:hypothetical protein